MVVRWLFDRVGGLPSEVEGCRLGWGCLKDGCAMVVVWLSNGCSMAAGWLLVERVVGWLCDGCGAELDGSAMVARFNYGCAMVV